MTRVFLTGATGFAGSHLVDSLLDDGYEVYGLVHPASGHQPPPEHENFIPIIGDLTDLAGLKSAFSDVRPSIVYHLGGIASPAQSWKNPAQTLAINAGGTANVLEAALICGKPKVIVVTSALLYSSLRESDLPIDEETPPSPSHPYAVSKWTAGILTTLYWRRYSLPVIEARPFNHIGPHQARGFVVPDFASQLAKISTGELEPVVKVGNLRAERDFTDVRDIVRAYRMLAESGTPGQPYLVCSGTSISIQHILDTLIKISGIDVEVVKDPDRYHSLETPMIYGNNAKINRDTGWQPTISLEQSLSDAYIEWRARYK
ncbi:MAG: GDP-mannose 4,6-dehydratase [Candidatus Promineifilaceae bacterium]